MYVRTVKTGLQTFFCTENLLSQLLLSIWMKNCKKQFQPKVRELLGQKNFGSIFSLRWTKLIVTGTFQCNKSFGTLFFQCKHGYDSVTKGNCKIGKCMLELKKRGLQTFFCPENLLLQLLLSISMKICKTNIQPKSEKKHLPVVREFWGQKNFWSIFHWDGQN